MLARPDPASIGPAGWLVLAITGVAALLRFATITSQSFWVDEATTVHEVSLSFGQMLHQLRIEETTPPLYFALAWVWTRVFGAGELGIRSLSALAGVALVPVAYLCGRELVSRAAGVVAAALVAVSPFMIWYSQEARSYMLFALLSGLSFLFAARAARTRASGDFAIWSVSSALAVLTHFFAGFLIAPEAVWLVWLLRADRRALRAALLACAVVAAAQGAVLPIAIGDTSHPLNWIPNTLSLSTRIYETPVDFAVSQLYRSPGLYVTSSTLALVGLLGTALLAAVAAAILWRGGGRRERSGATYAAGVGLVTVLVPIVLAWLGRDYVFSRNFIAAWVPLAVALAAACTAPRARGAGVTLAVVLVGGFAWAGVTLAGEPTLQRSDWRDAAAALGRPLGPRLIVAADGNFGEQPLAVYLRLPFSYLGTPTQAPAVRIVEVDFVGDAHYAYLLRRPLFPGMRLLRTRVVSGGLEVWRFALAPPGWTASEFGITANIRELFHLKTTPSVLFQR